MTPAETPTEWCDYCVWGKFDNTGERHRHGLENHALLAAKDARIRELMGLVRTLLPYARFSPNNAFDAKLEKQARAALARSSEVPK